MRVCNSLPFYLTRACASLNDRKDCLAPESVSQKFMFLQFRRRSALRVVEPQTRTNEVCGLPDLAFRQPWDLVVRHGALQADGDQFRYAQEVACEECPVSMVHTITLLSSRAEMRERTVVIEVLLSVCGTCEHGRREALARQLHHLREVVVLHGPVVACFRVEQPTANEQLERLPQSHVRACPTARDSKRGDTRDSRRPRRRRRARSLTGGSFLVRAGHMPRSSWRWAARRRAELYARRQTRESGSVRCVPWP